MKKLIQTILVSSISMMNISAQDFTSFCSATRTDGALEGTPGVLDVVRGEGGFVGTVNATAATETEFKWSIDQFWNGGVAASESIFKLKVKSSFAASFRIKVLSSTFSLTYDVPFVTNRTLIAGADYIEYSVTPDASYDPLKFQQIIFVFTPTADIANGTVNVKDFSYGLNGCEPSSVNSSSNLVSNVSLFPNPVSNETNLTATLKNNSKVKVIVNNMNGHTVFSSNDVVSSSINQPINTSNWAKGVYSVSLIVDGLPSKTEKLVVQ